MKDRYVYFDGLRGFAALAVVVHHAVISYDLALYSGLSADSRNAWDIVASYLPLQPAQWGNAAVCLFFLISGYVLSASYSTTSLSFGANVLKRYVRLTIPIVFASTLSCALQYFDIVIADKYQDLMHSSAIGPTIVPTLSFSNAIAQGLIAVYKISPVPYNYLPVVWTMPIEFAGSLVLVAIFAFSSRPLITMLALLVFSTPSYIGLFAAGSLLFLWRPAGFRIARKLKAPLLLVGLLLATFPHRVVDGYGWTYGFLTRRLFLLNVESAIHSVGAIILFIFVASSRPTQKLFSSRSMQWLGRISFPLYLIHVSLLLIVFCGPYVIFDHINIPQELAAAMSIAVYLIVTLTAATLLTPIMEVSAITLANRIGRLVDGNLQAWSPKLIASFNQVVAATRASFFTRSGE